MRVSGVGEEGVLAWVRETNELCPLSLAARRRRGVSADVGEGEG
jgi:hypothetical protein